MKTWDGIDAILVYSNEFTNDVSTLQSSAVQVRTHRERLWMRWQETLDEIWQGWEWPFRYTVGGALSLTSGLSSLAAPSDYHIGGYEGGLWIPAQNREIIFLPLHQYPRGIDRR